MLVQSVYFRRNGLSWNKAWTDSGIFRVGVLAGWGSLLDGSWEEGVQDLLCMTILCRYSESYNACKILTRRVC